MGTAPGSARRGGRPPGRPPTLVAVAPPLRARRDRHRPITPRRQPAYPEPRAAGPVGPLVMAAEASLIAEWREARQAHDVARAAELSDFLWTANRSLIERTASRMRGVAREEARQIATVGLFRALARFDGTRGIPFAAYASFWFRKETQRGRAAISYRVALPVHMLSALTDGDDNPNPTIRGLGHASTLDPNLPVPTIAPSPEDVVVALGASADIRAHLATLSSLSRRIIELRFGFDGAEPRSNRAVAAVVGVSEYTVRTHLRRALRTLRARLEGFENG